MKKITRAIEKSRRDGKYGLTLSNKLSKLYNIEPAEVSRPEPFGKAPNIQNFPKKKEEQE